MSLYAAVSSLLARTFGPQWAALAFAARNAVADDFALLCRVEYDVDDPTTADSVARESMEDAATVYAKRIGPGNLSAYAATLLAGIARNAR